MEMALEAGYLHSPEGRPSSSGSLLKPAPPKENIYPPGPPEQPQAAARIAPSSEKLDIIQRQAREETLRRLSRSLPHSDRIKSLASRIHPQPQRQPPLSDPDLPYSLSLRRGVYTRPSSARSLLGVPGGSKPRLGRVRGGQGPGLAEEDSAFLSAPDPRVRAATSHELTFLGSRDRSLASPSPLGTSLGSPPGAASHGLPDQSRLDLDGSGGESRGRASAVHTAALRLETYSGIRSASVASDRRSIVQAENGPRGYLGRPVDNLGVQRGRVSPETGIVARGKVSAIFDKLFLHLCLRFV